MTLREQLLEMGEPKYRDFIMPLMPGVRNVIGIRIPLLRRIAREIVRGDWRAYLDEEAFYFEERMLQGFVIGHASCPPEERLALTARFIPRIDNWSLCDFFSLRKVPKAERDTMWEFIRPRFRSGAEYEVRFAAVTALDNFIDDGHLEQLLALLEEVGHEGYYARMGVAWAVSACFVKYPERCAAWLQDCRLDEPTRDRALQKIVESSRVDADTKERIRAVRRGRTRQAAHGVHGRTGEPEHGRGIRPAEAERNGQS